MGRSLSPSDPGHLPWVIVGWGRISTAIVAGALAYLLTGGLPGELNRLVTYNTAVAVYIALFCVLMGRASPEQAAELSRRWEPSGLKMLLGVNLVSVASLVAVADMLNHSSGRLRGMTNLHMATSLLAVILSWLLGNIFFGLHYIRLYYDDIVVNGKTNYQLGLEYPERPTPNFLDFMYYSFTIAMCYSTSDVSVTSVRMRCVTLLQAIFSFLFASAIIGFVVNIISNIT